MTLEQMQSEQERDLDALNRGVATMEAKLAGLDKQLPDEVLRARVAEIRAEAGKAFNPYGQNTEPTDGARAASRW
jgi:hypothetical protein